MHSSQAICFFLCPLYMGKDILTIGDKNRLDARKHKKEVRVGESCCTVHALPLQPCLVCTLGRWQDLMFHQLLSHSITATPFAAVIPLCAAAKNHMHCAVWTALHLSGAATNNRKRGINQISRVRHRICFSLVISCPILCPRPCTLSQLLNWCKTTPSWCLSWSSLHLCCYFPDTEDPLYHVVFFFDSLTPSILLQTLLLWCDKVDHIH